MPYFRSYTKNELNNILNKIREARYEIIGELSITAWVTEEPVSFSDRKTGEKKELHTGDKWGNLFDCAWFNFTANVPDEAKDKKIVLLIDVNGELCVFDSDGTPVRGLTNKSSIFDKRLGAPTKRIFNILNKSSGGEKIDIWADAGCNDLFGELKENGTIKEAYITICNDDIRSLYYDFEVLYDLMKALTTKTARYNRIYNSLMEAGSKLKTFSPTEIKEAGNIIAPELDRQGGDPSLSISAIGHAHLDLAWLWPIRETKRKGVRTFATALELMERYPDYIFGVSQPQLFQWMKETYPSLYKKIKKRVKEGRLEVQGAMWVESDTNIPSGESLIRQLFYGKEFFRNEFGREMNYLWEPDVFGYSASLPQILKKSGVDYFITQKLSWNLINKHPHHSFKWKGIDGSVILTHLLPEETYNGPASPLSVMKIEQNYLDKGISDQCLMAFGIGDGGGGPGAEHLERLKRMKNLAGLCPIEQRTVADFLTIWEKDKESFAAWDGELYLERHQGTFTTQCKSKWYNRRMEIRLRELEWKAVLSGLVSETEYPAESLERIWKEVLLYQFHDILPGSSIKRVYDESLERYALMLEETEKLISDHGSSIVNNIDTSETAKPYVFQNSLSWDREEWVKVENTWREILVPAMGYVVIDSVSDGSVVSNQLTALTNKLENELLVISFNDDGSIKSIVDKEFHKEILSPAGMGNCISIYEDDGDAWDFSLNYREKKTDAFVLLSSETEINGPKASITYFYKYKNSEMKQQLILTNGSRRIDFITWINWQEPAKMIKTSFPLAVKADHAVCEIQFGSIKRPTHSNTTWDMAKDEVPAQKWVDISNRHYGVALLNDSKYGYRVKDSTLELTLVRCVRYPGPLIDKGDFSREISAYTDLGEHNFTYSLYPHPGDYAEGGVVQAGYELNIPLTIQYCSSKKGSLPTSFSYMVVESPSVIIETVKKAERSSEIIVRLYETTGEPCHTTLQLNFPVTKVLLVNLMEEPIGEILVDEGSVELDFIPFEILTLGLSVVR